MDESRERKTLSFAREGQISKQQLHAATAWEAVEYLKRRSAKRGREYRIALQHAVDGLKSARAAQASFVAAAKTAGILV